MQEGHAVAGQALENEALAAEQPRADAALPGDVELGAHCRAQERIALGDDLAAHLREIHRDDLAGVARCEADLRLAAGTGVGEVGEEQRFARNDAFAGALELAPHARARLGAVAHDRLKRDTVFDEHHRARFADDGLARIQLDLDELHVVAKYLIVDFVALHGGGS